LALSVLLAVSAPVSELRFTLAVVRTYPDRLRQRKGD
jgi:hypothetical protein